MTEKSLAYAEQAAMALRAQRAVLSSDYDAWQAQLAHFTPLIRRVIAQTERRVLRGKRSRPRTSS